MAWLLGFLNHRLQRDSPGVDVVVKFTFCSPLFGAPKLGEESLKISAPFSRSPRKTLAFKLHLSEIFCEPNWLQQVPSRL
jgi:hypothetical protein